MFTNKELGVFSDLLDTFVDGMDTEDLKNNLGISYADYELIVEKLKQVYEKPVLSLFDDYIEVFKKGDQFTVVYGKSRTSGLFYQDAYQSLGQAIFHHLATKGLID